MIDLDEIAVMFGATPDAAGDAEPLDTYTENLADEIIAEVDRNGDDKLTWREIRKWLYSRYREEKRRARKMFRAADTDGDRKVDKAELVAAINSGSVNITDMAY